ncbi:hypothetical protein, partial [Okeania sp. SIO3B5]|uniref:hypothetical protein n=1 Tax=Okeania sp. SIO3B5 TaxID=2607811 RepID=UPI0025E8B020
RKLVRGRGGKHQTTAKEAAPCVSGSYAKQSVNPPKSYDSVGIPAPLGRGGCQILFTFTLQSEKLIWLNLFRTAAQTLSVASDENAL